MIVLAWSHSQKLAGHFVALTWKSTSCRADTINLNVGVPLRHNWLRRAKLPSRLHYVSELDSKLRKRITQIHKPDVVIKNILKSKGVAIIAFVFNVHHQWWLVRMQELFTQAAARRRWICMELDHRASHSVPKAGGVANMTNEAESLTLLLAWMFHVVSSVYRIESSESNLLLRLPKELTMLNQMPSSWSKSRRWQTRRTGISF